MGGDDYVSLRSEVEFLLERLDELELDDTPEDFVRDWYGHVAPPLERVRAMLSAAPPSPRSDDGDGKPVAWQWKQTDPFSGAPFWHHDQYYNGNRSEVSRPLYLRPSPTRDETIEMCAKWHDEQAAQYDVKRQEWIERGLILAADKCDDLSDNHRRHAASIRSLKSTPDAEGE